MKNILVFALFIILSTNVFAADPQCPSLEKIRTTQFKNGFNELGDWIVYTNISNDDKEVWTVEASVMDSHDQDKDTILKYATDTIKIASLNNPIAIKRDNRTECYYTGQHAAFFLVAFNPALEIPQML